MICPPHSPAPVVEDWLARHQHRASFLLHLVGIPLSLAGFLLSPYFLILLSYRMLLFSSGLFVAGYLLQFLGHALEGTEPGEVTQIRLWFKRRIESRKGLAIGSGQAAGSAK